MANIAKQLTDLIGNTPVVELGKFSASKGLKKPLLAKVEYFNPGGSVKDRIALAMIEDAEQRGVLAPGATIIEPTSGNTGVGLALVSAVKGYKLILTMPDTMSIERRNLVKAYGAEVRLTPGKDGMKGAIAEAEKLKAEIPGSVILQQFENKANPARHYATTGPELWKQLDGKVDIFVAGVGTGGTVSGVGKYLKEQNPDVRIVAVEPLSSPVLNGGQSGPHKIQGIGAGFVRRGGSRGQRRCHTRRTRGGQTGRTARGHIGWCGSTCCRRGGKAPRERRQEHCGAAARHRRALPEHCALCFRRLPTLVLLIIDAA